MPRLGVPRRGIFHTFFRIKNQPFYLAGLRSKVVKESTRLLFWP
jgi:hypothetical protein